VRVTYISKHRNTGSEPSMSLWKKYTQDTLSNDWADTKHHHGAALLTIAFLVIVAISHLTD
jgi:hypothetical protein